MAVTPSEVLKVKTKAHRSRRNFGNAASRKRGEANFLAAFERAYFRSVGKGGLAAGEFALEGYGVADLVWIAWRPDGGEEFSALSLEKSLLRRKLHAFEAKLKDWRRALKQAFRYRYFADKAIVLMPAANAAPALVHLERFRDLGVGFWTFDVETGTIRKHFTPTRVSAYNSKARAKAVARLSSSVQLGKLRKKL